MPGGNPSRIAKKDKIRVVIHTRDHTISGEVYLYENSRLSDILNAEPDKLYLPMTDVTMENHISNKTIKKDFILIHKSSIELLYLDEETKDAAASHTMQAKKYLNNLNFDGAVTEARRALSIDETNSESHYILGIALGKKQMLDQALKEFELALKYADQDSRVYMLAQDMINQIKI
ncbi:MAG: tetratricopeptide repeat protein [Candidatus Muiribacteriota bacterium]